MGARLVHPVADGIWSLRTSSSWGLTVNAFIVTRGGDPVFIDMGFPGATESLLASLAELKIEPGRVAKVLYTHSHPDHMGGGVTSAGVFERAEHYFWEGTTPALGNYHAFYAALPNWRDWLAGVLPLGPRRDALLKLFPSRPSSTPAGDGHLPRRRPIAFGETVEAGDLRLECIDARGHDPYHAAWIDRRLGWLFSGDVLLTNPTPLLPSLRDELPTYRATLDRWGRSLNANLVIPGHGRPLSDFQAAVARSAAQVRALFDDVIARLESGRVDPLDVAGLSSAPTPGELRRGLIAIGGVISQLTELEGLGVARRCDDARWELSGVVPDYAGLITQ